MSPAEAHERMMADLAKFKDPRIKCVILNLRRIASRGFKASPNWVLVKEAFGFGRTYSYWLCNINEIDPEASR